MAPRFGLVLSNRNVVIANSPVTELLRLADTAEAGGWDDVWVGDSFGAKPRVESLVLLSAIAARTSRVRLGPACMATTPLRNPIQLAYQWCSLDLLSGGRTVFVACQGQARPGNWPGEFQGLNVDPSSRTRRMIEAIQILRRLSSEEQVSFEGELHPFQNLTVEPKPVQRPIPIWIASSPNLKSPKNVESAYSRVATQADGWMTIAKTAEEIATSLELIRGYATQAGKPLAPGFESCLYFNVNLNDSADRAVEESQDFMERYYNVHFSRENLERTGSLGPASACIDRIHALIEAGVTTFAVRFMSFDQSSQVERFTSDVLRRIS